MMFAIFNLGYWIYYFSYNPMNLLINSLPPEDEDGTVHVEEAEALMSSTTLSPEMLQALNENWYVTINTLFFEMIKSIILDKKMIADIMRYLTNYSLPE